MQARAHHGFMTMPLRDDGAAERAATVERLRQMPEAMRVRSQWLLWKSETVPGRDGLQKVPYYVNGSKRFGDLGGEVDRQKLADFETALKRFGSSAQFTGVGFAFLADDGLIGIDLDEMVDPDTGELRAEHQAIMECCSSYTERSPSGKGAHIIVAGQCDSFKHDPAGVEVYCGGRYFTCTGDRVSGTPAEVQPLKPYALAYLQQVVEKSKAAAKAARAAAGGGVTSVVSGPASLPQGVQGGDDFKRVNDAALRTLSAWVPTVLPAARSWQAGYRVTSKDLGRDLQEDLQLLPEGIMDFGEEQGMSPIDVVLKWGPGLSTPKAALQWLAPIVGVQLSRARHLRLAAGAAAPSADERPEPPPPPLDGDEAAAPAKPGRRQKKPAGPPEGGGGVAAKLIEHYALIRGTDQVWDGELRTVMQVKNLRLLFGAPFVNDWLANRERRLLRPDQIKFEPGLELTDGSVNLFDGLPTEPVVCTDDEVAPILDLLRHLCSLSAPTPEGCEAVFTQVLRWCAVIVQSPGAKMRFAPVFHGPQGTGKNMFWDTYRRILGQYGKMVGQAELEDRFNGYMSGKLLLVANEVMTRTELFHGKNKLKWVITEDEIPIRGMHQETRWESNHANLVFLSNETMPLALEKDDRRYLVVYTPAADHPDLYNRMADFIRNDGSAKFLHYLQRLDIEDFGEHTKPLMTQAKEDLIQLGLKPAERFSQEWLDGVLDLPVQVCSVDQLFRVFIKWADMNGHRWPGDKATFSQSVKRYIFEIKEYDDDGQRLPPRVVQKPITLKDPVGHRKTVRCWIPRGCGPLNGVSEGEWAWPAVEAFAPHVRRFGRERFEEMERDQ